MTDWEKRALELFPQYFGGPVGMNVPVYTARILALQLAREMADERAEEIAQRLDRLNPCAAERSVESHCAAIARSTIQKPEPLPGVDRERFMRGQFLKGDPERRFVHELTERDLSEGLSTYGLKPEVEASIRADEREKTAESIACQCLKDLPAARDLPWHTEYGKGHAHGRQEAAAIARSFKGQPTKTREQILEEALREIHNSHASQFCADIARRALKYTPDTSPGAKETPK